MKKQEMFEVMKKKITMSTLNKLGIHKEEVEDLREYLQTYYGNDSLYGKDFFPNNNGSYGVSISEMNLAIWVWYSACLKNKTDETILWEGSWAREVLRDIMFFHRGNDLTKVEHGLYIALDILKLSVNHKFVYDCIAYNNFEVWDLEITPSRKKDINKRVQQILKEVA